MAEQQTKLNANSYISLGVMVVIITAAFQLSTKLARIESDLQAIRIEINSRMSDRWTATMQGVWAREVTVLNPNFKTPVVEDIQRRFPPGSIREHGQ